MALALPSSFIRAASMLSGMTLLSRVLGLVREAVCARIFGVGGVWDAFVIAFCVPNLSRRLFGEGALSSAFVPQLTEKLQREDHEAARRFTGVVVWRLVIGLGALAFVGSGVLVSLSLWRPSLTADLMAIMLPYMPLICAVALLAGAQNAIGRFAAPAFMPILFNVILIAVVWSLGRSGGMPLDRLVLWLAATVLLAGLVQFIAQWVALTRAGLRPAWQWRDRDRDLPRLWATMGPMVLGLSVVQLNTLGDLLVAKLFIAEGGGPSALTYATRLYQLPVGLFGAALATAIFPLLTRMVSGSDNAGFDRTLDRGVRLALFVGLPASAGLWAVRTSLVEVVFEGRAFSSADTVRVASVLSAYAAGVWAYIAQQVLIRGYYALGDTGRPVRIASAMVVLNLTLNLILVRPLGETGIALATALSAALQVGLLALFFSRTGRQLHTGPVLKSVARVVFAVGVMVVVVEGMGAVLSHNTLVRLIIQVGAGGAAFLIVARCLRCAELSELSKGMFMNA
jgi:putative peptidoglycan lipid II flippase